MSATNTATESEERYDQEYGCPTTRCEFSGTVPEFIYDEEDIDKGQIFVCPTCGERTPKSQLNEGADNE